MAQYRKKPVVIEAIQWTGQNHREMFNFLGGENEDYLTASGTNFYIDWSKVEGGLIINTLEGEHIATIGDWIIKGIKGEYYPCKPDIFEATYEPVNKTTMTQQTNMTAVEWLIEQLTEVDYGCINKTFSQNNNSLAGHKLRELFEKAKQMEKEQIIKAHCFGQILENEHDYIGMNEEINAEIYYDKKFKILTIKVTSTKW